MIAPAATRAVHRASTSVLTDTAPVSGLFGRREFDWDIARKSFSTAIALSRAVWFSSTAGAPVTDIAMICFSY
ncbi:hypothetical protein D3C84_1206310 [compost metagenome]